MARLALEFFSTCRQGSILSVDPQIRFDVLSHGFDIRDAAHDLVKFVFRLRIPGDQSLLTQFLCRATCIHREPRRTRVIVGSMNMGYGSDTARNRSHNLFRPKCAPIPGDSDGLLVPMRPR